MLAASFRALGQAWHPRKHESRRARTRDYSENRAAGSMPDWPRFLRKPPPGRGDMREEWVLGGVGVIQEIFSLVGAPPAARDDTWCRVLSPRGPGPAECVPVVPGFLVRKTGLNGVSFPI